MHHNRMYMRRLCENGASDKKNAMPQVLLELPWWICSLVNEFANM